ncbi:MAG: L,D-transpeptidase family protein [Jatrophihabitans sp.]|uniref:L,D-transpeptidase family protein n=1 Tax=Jatrophihabitans sp. TaxID=1932789 RepID=UPI003F81D2A9
MIARFLASSAAAAAVVGCSVLAVHLHDARESGQIVSPAQQQVSSSGIAARAGAATAAVTGTRLPVHRRTFDATQVITVVARSSSSTTATLQAWRKAPGGGWIKRGPAILAHVGAAGIGVPSEFRSNTPAGTFTITQTFGYRPNPGIRLRWFRSTPADWWISQAGPLYNTHQRCSSGCHFNLGSPNEHLYYERPYYAYAAVINTPSGAGAYPRGSAFFLHVTDGTPTAGCVAIPQAPLVDLLKWLNPAAHPRILLGVA